jgi:hypothetical protein
MGTTTDRMPVKIGPAAKMLLIALFHSTKWMDGVRQGNTEAVAEPSSQYDTLAATWLPRYAHAIGTDVVTAASRILEHRSAMDQGIAPAIEAWTASCQADHNDAALRAAADAAVTEAVATVQGNFPGWDDRYTRTEIAEVHGRNCENPDCTRSLEP